MNLEEYRLSLELQAIQAGTPGKLLIVPDKLPRVPG
jgi:hypothetical protein